MWSQIAERLRQAIEEGAFKPGEALPGEAELNRRFGVSRHDLACGARLSGGGRIDKP